MTQIGFFEKYFIVPFFGKYSDFKGEESRRAAFLSLGAWLIVTAGLFGILLGLIGLLGPEVGFWCLGIIGGLWIVASVYPFAALFSRASHGHASEEDSKPHFLFIDKMFSVICILFLILGILMAVTTLNSGEINPYHRGSGDAKPNPLLEQEKIVEEPIFTYQDNVPAEVEDMPEETDEIADTVSVDESFDPVIESITAASDSVAINE